MEPADLAVKIPRHHFPLGVVAGSLALVVRAGTRLQRVPAVLAMRWGWLHLGGATASYWTVRLWVLRLGLYQLNRPKEQADDWMWIVDHTMQLGPWKCMILVGIRQAKWNVQDRCLHHEDVELIDLQPVTESNGEVVYRQLEAAVAKTGVPRAIVSDDGRDLHAGVNRFLEAHPATTWLYDIKHKTAVLLEHELKHDASWPTFVEEVNRFKQRVSLTELACLMPPQQRSKARYMNVDVLLDWGEKHRLLLDRPQTMRQVGLEVAAVEEKLGWLRKFTSPLCRWREMLAVIETVEHYVRHEGIHPQAAEELASRLPRPRSTKARRLRKELLEFMRKQAQQARDGERLLGSSEVLESIIGKFKHLAGERGQQGLTGMVLGIGALVGKVAVAAVQTALSEFTTRNVWDWCKTHLGSTVQSLRHRITLALSAEQNRPLLLPGRT